MITVTDDAVTKILSMVEAENDDTIIGFRVAIQGGGCGGMTYVFEFVKTNDENLDEDNVVEVGDLKVHIDPLSAGYLNGAEVKFKQTIGGEFITIENPNAKVTCGCGSSFNPS